VQSRSVSKEQISEDRLNFFEKTAKNPAQEPRSGYTREYSYNIDSDLLRHSGQSDPRGLGFSYEKADALHDTYGKSATQKHQGTALAFTYDPQVSKSDSVSERTRAQQKDTVSKTAEPKYASNKPIKLRNDMNQLEDGPTRSARSSSPGSKGEIKQSNIDESSELSSTSHESMVDEYARESMRQKTSALIAGSTAKSAPFLTRSNIYKAPITPNSSDNTVPKEPIRAKSPVETEKLSRNKFSANSGKINRPTQSSLWDQDRSRTSQSTTTRLPVFTPAEPVGAERKYTHVSRKRVVKNSDGSYEETEEILDPESIETKQGIVEPRPNLFSVKSQFTILFFTPNSFVSLKLCSFLL